MASRLISNSLGVSAGARRRQSNALPLTTQPNTRAGSNEALRVVMRDDGGLLQMTGDVLELQAGREPELAADDRRRRQMLGVD